jgi:hypothetical protein
MNASKNYLHLAALLGVFSVLLPGCSKLPSHSDNASIKLPKSSLTCTWETTQLYSERQIDFAGASKLRLVIFEEDNMYLFAIYPDGKVFRCHDSRPTITASDKMYLGPIGSCMAFYWQLEGDKLIWSKQGTPGPVCTFKRVGNPEESVAENWMDSCYLAWLVNDSR